MAFNGSWSEDEEKKTIKSLNDLKSVYKEVRYDWPQLIGDEVLPIEMAIAFLDDTSVGLAHRKSEFDELCDLTSKALKTSVVENHETFNNSVGLYHVLLSIVKESQEDSLHIKDLIDKSTRDMNDRSHHLRDLDNSSAKYTEMIEILDAMEYLRDIQNVIDKLITEKKIHEVYDVIAEAHKIAAKYNLWSLSAMSSTRTYLEAQSNNLYDMILDEIQNEIYLKNVSVSSDRREAWNNLIQSNNPQMTSLKTLIDLLTTLELYIYNSANLDICEIADSFTESAKNFLEVQLPKLHAHYSKADSTKIDYSILLLSALNPAAESFHYIFMLLLTASKLNKLHPVLEILSSTAQQEIHSLISRTTEEARQKNLQRLARLSKTRNIELVSAEDKISGQLFNDASVPILQDFFGSFFLKCVHILMNHKIAWEIVQLFNSDDIVSRSGTTTGLRIYDFKSIWMATRKEIEALMTKYISSEIEDHSPLTSEHKNTNKLFQAMTNKQLFLFDNVSYQSSSKTSDDIKLVLNEVFPGFLVNTSKNTHGNDTSLYISNEDMSALAEPLVPQSIFNMRVILEFFLIFTVGAHKLFTNFEKTKGTSMIAYQFFYEFMKSSFLRKLEADLDASLHECMSKPGGNTAEAATGIISVGFCQATVNLNDQDASSTFVPNMKSSGVSSIYSNAVRFRRLLTHTCQTLNTSFSYRKDMTDVVLLLVKKFSSAYNDYYHELLSSGGSHDITEIRFGLNDSQNKHILQIRKWMRVPAMLDVTGSILQNHEDKDKLRDLVEEEIELMFSTNDSVKSVFDVSKDDLLDDKWFDHVCYLLLTSSWILSWLPSMRKESNYNYNEGTSVTEAEQLKHDWVFMENGRSPLTITERTQNDYLTLTLEKIGEFDKAVEVFEAIRDNSLIALRYDLRLKGLYYIGKSFQDNFRIPTEPADADQFITAFNKEIYYIGTKINEMLNVDENDCVFAGLPEFLNKALIQGSYLVTITNSNGIKKILLNVFVLQQMLRSIMKRQDVADLTVASKYFQLYMVSDHSLLQEMTSGKKKYLKNELLNILRLTYSEKLHLNSSSTFNRTKYNEMVKKISKVFS